MMANRSPFVNAPADSEQGHRQFQNWVKSIRAARMRRRTNWPKYRFLTGAARHHSPSLFDSAMALRQSTTGKNAVARAD